MKKVIYFTVLTLIFAIFTSNPAEAQWGKRKKTITTKDTGDKEVVIPVIEPEKDAEPEKPEAGKTAINAPAGSDLAKLMAEVEKLKKAIKTKASKDDLKASKKALLDSLREERDARRFNMSYLQGVGEARYKQMLDSLAKDARAVAQLTIRANNGDTLAEEMLTDIEILKSKSQNNLYLWSIVIFLLVTLIGVTAYLVWQKNKMGVVLERIQGEKDPDNINFRGNSRQAYGDRVASEPA